MWRRAGAGTGSQQFCLPGAASGINASTRGYRGEGNRTCLAAADGTAGRDTGVCAPPQGCAPPDGAHQRETLRGPASGVGGIVEAHCPTGRAAAGGGGAEKGSVQGPRGTVGVSAGTGWVMWRRAGAGTGSQQFCLPGAASGINASTRGYRGEGNRTCLAAADGTAGRDTGVCAPPQGCAPPDGAHQRETLRGPASGVGGIVEAHCPTGRAAAGGGGAEKGAASGIKASTRGYRGEGNRTCLAAADGTAGRDTGVCAPPQGCAPPDGAHQRETLRGPASGVGGIVEAHCPTGRAAAGGGGAEKGSVQGPRGTVGVPAGTGWVMWRRAGAGTGSQQFCLPGAASGIKASTRGYRGEGNRTCLAAADGTGGRGTGVCDVRGAGSTTEDGGTGEEKRCHFLAVVSVPSGALCPPRFPCSDWDGQDACCGMFAQCRGVFPGLWRLTSKPVRMSNEKCLEGQPVGLPEQPPLAWVRDASSLPFFQLFFCPTGHSA
ncbi:uncharacterized PE-PGRS family protein PE_PGRS54-like isoform X4 [Anser cygnoides]|uniref:uncharacterized PE-PGRS family protein PE_PGRS54-like isoform X4 n=1 Tax=Anser cygnoides TaxID=8845 RepID=UPI0034D20A81